MTTDTREPADGGHASVSTEPEPCQCHRSFAVISPTHTGHCCFVPATQTCHEAEVEAWLAAKLTRRTA